MVYSLYLSVAQFVNITKHHMCSCVCLANVPLSEPFTKKTRLASMLFVGEMPSVK